MRVRDMDDQLQQPFGDPSAGREVNLTAKEFDLLQLFVNQPRQGVQPRDACWKAYGSMSYLGDLRTVDVHIRRLREKIETQPRAAHVFIFTKWGVGYYFTDKD